MGCGVCDTPELWRGVVPQSCVRCVRVAACVCCGVAKYLRLRSHI